MGRFAQYLECVFVHLSVSLCFMTVSMLTSARTCVYLHRGHVYVGARCALWACILCMSVVRTLYVQLSVCVFSVMDCLSGGSIAPLSPADGDIKSPVT